jgi:hypothetical protein
MSCFILNEDGNCPPARWDRSCARPKSAVQTKSRQQRGLPTMSEQVHIGQEFQNGQFWSKYPGYSGQDVRQQPLPATINPTGSSHKFFQSHTGSKGSG